MKCQICGKRFRGEFCPDCGAPGGYERETRYTKNSSHSTPPSTEYDPEIGHVKYSPTLRSEKKPVKPIIVILSIISLLAVSFTIIGLIPLYNGSKNVSTEKILIYGTGSSQNSNVTTPFLADKVTVIDFSQMDKSAIKSWADTNKVTCDITEDYNNAVEKGSVISQSVKTGYTINERDTITVVISLGKKPPDDYLNALKAAKSYSDNLYYSKKNIYNLLIMGYLYSDDAVQYAMNNLNADFNKNALEKAKSYKSNLHLLNERIYKNLISDADGFTEEEAQYAIDHLDG